MLADFSTLCGTLLQDLDASFGTGATPLEARIYNRLKNTIQALYNEWRRQESHSIWDDEFPQVPNSVSPRLANEDDQVLPQRNEGDVVSLLGCLGEAYFVFKFANNLPVIGRLEVIIRQAFDLPSDRRVQNLFLSVLDEVSLVRVLYRALGFIQPEGDGLSNEYFNLAQRLDAYEGAYPQGMPYPEDSRVRELLTAQGIIHAAQEYSGAPSAAFGR